MIYIKYFETEEERQACTDTYKYLSYTVESQRVNIHPKAFFCKLTLNNGEVVEIERSGTLTSTMVKQYKSTTVDVKIGELCTDIGDNAFVGFTELSSVTIHDNVTSIGVSVFSNCTSLPIIDNVRYADKCLVKATKQTLTEHTIKEGTKWIGSTAFNGCKNLTSITIPNSVISIGPLAFQGCKLLPSIIIPNSVTNIDGTAFNSCTSLPIENNIRYADTFAVVAIDKTLSTYTLKEGTRFIGQNAFKDCSSLTSITIPNSVTYIGTYAFYDCSLLLSITIPNGITSIGSYTFYGCASLLNVTIPNSVTYIAVTAFSGCTNLSNININMELIPSCFSGFTSITSVTIGNGVTRIDKNAFSGCSGLTSISSLAITAPRIRSNAFENISTTGTLYVPQGSTGYNTWLTTLGEGWTMEYIS